MPTPDDNLAARLVIRVLENNGVQITVTIQGDDVHAEATDTGGQVYRHERDDGDLLGAVCEVAGRCGYEF